MEVDFPSSREDFRRQTGRDFAASFNSSQGDDDGADDVEESILSCVTSTSSRFEGTGSLLWPSTDEGRKKKKKRKKQQPAPRPNSNYASSNASSLSNHEVGAGNIAVDFPADRTPFLRRYNREESMASTTKLGADESVGGGGRRQSRSHSNGSGESSQQRRRRISHSSSISSNEGGATLNDSRASELSSRRRRRSSGSDIRSNDASSEDALNQLRQSLRASWSKRNSSGRHTPKRRTSHERRPSQDDLLELELRPSLVKSHNANASALPVLGWDVENQSDTSSFLNCASSSIGDVVGPKGYKTSSSNVKNSAGDGHDGGIGGLQRSFHSATSSQTSLELVRVVPVHHDNANINGEFLCEEFITRGSFQRSTSLNAIDNKTKGSMEEQLIMEEEYDQRKPWRKAPAVAVNCKNNNRRASASTRGSIGSLNFDPDVMKDFYNSAEYQQIQAVKAYQEHQKEQQQQLKNWNFQASEPDDDDDQDKLMQSSRSSRSQQAMTDDVPTLAVAEPAINEAISFEPPQEDASTSQGLPIADESTVLSSLAQDDDDSELTELRHAQEALFPIQEGDLSKKSTAGSSEIDASLRQSEQSDAISGTSFGVEALENSEYLEPIIEGNEKKQAHRNNVSLDIVQEEDRQIAQERILQRKLQQKQLQIEDIIKEQEKIQKQQEEQERMQREQKKLNAGRTALSSDDFGAGQIRKDLQLDDLPSSARDIFGRNNRNNDSDTLNYGDIEANLTPPSIRVCLNVIDDSIENEFATTKLENVEFGGAASKLYEDEKLDVSELGLLFEANCKDDRSILDDSSSRRSDGRSESGRTSSKVSKRTVSTLDSAFGPLRNILKRSASSMKTATNIKRRNKRLWKFCVWNCRKITVCVILLIGILVSIGVLAWLGVTKSADKNIAAEKNSFFASAEGSGNIVPSVVNKTDSAADGIEIEATTEEANSTLSHGEQLPQKNSIVVFESFNSTQLASAGSTTEDNGAISADVLTNITENTTLEDSNFSFNSTGSNQTFEDSDISYNSSFLPDETFTLNSTIWDNLTLPPYSSDNNSTSGGLLVIQSSGNETSVNDALSEANLTNHTLSSIAVSTLGGSESSPEVGENSTTSNSSLDSTLVANDTSTASFVNETQLNTKEEIVSFNTEDSIENSTTYILTEENSNDSELNATMEANKTRYILIQNLTGLNEYDYAGSSVVMSPDGDFAAVGFKEELGLMEKSGVVRVYQRIGETYVLLGGDILGNATGDEFGSSISLSNDGKRVAIGARGSSSSDKERNGEVKVFEYAVNLNTWLQIGSSIQGLDKNDEFGFSVSMSGDGTRFASGSPRGNGGTGSASVYEHDGVDWVRIGDTLNGGDYNDRFGFSLSLSNYGDILAIGASSKTVDSLEDCGGVNVYKFIGSAWTNLGQPLIGNSVTAHFGWATSLSGDGKRIVIGAKGQRVENLTKAGICEVFELHGEEWSRIGELLGENENEEAGRQVSMAIDGSVFSCSKLRHFDNGSSNGEVVILQETESEWNIVDQVTSSQGIAPSFGLTVAISEFGQYMIVGADEHLTSSGTVDILLKVD